MTIDVPIRLSFEEGFSPDPGGVGILIDPIPELWDRINIVFGKPKPGGSGSGWVIVSTPKGYNIPVPAGWVPRPTHNGKGIVYQRPGVQRDTGSVRIMDPTNDYPEGYLRYYNDQGGGQALDAQGKPGSRPATHISLDDQTGVPGYYQWLGAV